MLQQTSKYYAQEAMKCVDRYDCHDYMIRVRGDGHGGGGQGITRRHLVCKCCHGNCRVLI